MKKIIYIALIVFSATAIFSLPQQSRKDKVLELNARINEIVQKNNYLIDLLDSSVEQTVIIAPGDTVRRILTTTVAERTRIRSAMKANYDTLSVLAARARVLIP